MFPAVQRRGWEQYIVVAEFRVCTVPTSGFDKGNEGSVVKTGAVL